MMHRTLKVAELLDLVLLNLTAKRDLLCLALTCVQFSKAALSQLWAREQHNFNHLLKALPITTNDGVIVRAYSCAVRPTSLYFRC